MEFATADGTGTKNLIAALAALEPLTLPHSGFSNVVSVSVVVAVVVAAAAAAAADVVLAVPVAAAPTFSPPPRLPLSFGLRS